MRRIAVAAGLFLMACTSFGLSLQDYLNAASGSYELSIFSNGDDLWNGPNEGFHLPPPGYALSIEIKWNGDQQEFILNQNGAVVSGRIVYQDLGREVPIMIFRNSAGVEVGSAWFWNKDFDEIEYSSGGRRVSSFDMNLARIKKLKGKQFGASTSILYFMLPLQPKSTRLSGLWMLVKKVD